MVTDVADGPAARDPESNTEGAILAKFGEEIPHFAGEMNDPCETCKALHWIGERTLAGQRKPEDKFNYSPCCQGGQVEVPATYFGGHDTPPFMRFLFTSMDEASKEFRQHIRTYNNCLSFVSLGAKIDESVNTHGGHSFRISGQLVHNMGTLLPTEPNAPKFAQIFVWGGRGEEEAAMRAERSRLNLNQRIIIAFQSFFYNHNPYAKLFRSAREVVERSPVVSIRLKTMPKEGRDWRLYNFPTVDEVAMIVEGPSDMEGNERDLILHTADNQLKRVSDLHTGYLPLRYPIFFPYGSQGWDEYYTSEKSKRADNKVTNLEFFAYLLFKRPDKFSAILHGGRLFQELCVDLYCCVEHWRLQWYRSNQAILRAEMYSGVVEALGRNDFTIGRAIILPATFIGGARHMTQLYHDAMALVREFGPPSFFITMTANDNWPEIRDNLEPGQKAEDRPDLVVRVFHLKLKELLKDVTKRGRLGKCLSWVYTIEWQKRGRPHAHIILIMDGASSPNNIRAIDATVLAQLPDPVTEPELYKAVTTFMLHGPCKEGSACWKSGYCKSGYPHPYAESTTMTDDTYPNYARPNNGRHFTRNGFTYTNQNVVPYNAYLLLKFNCHINVEVPISIKALKYLYKYITKGADRAAMTLTANDEIDVHVDGRFVAAPEAIWRLMAFEISGRSPNVVRLALHLENAHLVYFANNANLARNVDSGKAGRTTLTEFFRLCAEDDWIADANCSIRALCYPEICSYYWWDKSKKELKRRVNKTRCVSRIYFASITAGERYYLRLLLCAVPGPTSFANLRTVDNVVYSTFREAAVERGLLLGDRHYVLLLEDTALWLRGSQLRDLFALILKHSPPADPLALWNRFKHNLCDDCAHAIRQVNPHEIPTQAAIHALGLAKLSSLLQAMGSSLSEAGLPPLDLTLVNPLTNTIIRSNAQSSTPENSDLEFRRRYHVMNSEQRNVVNTVVNTLLEGRNGLFFLDGPGGTGKTYVVNALLHFCNAHNIPSTAVASSGIAALLLLNGKTSHSGFKIPIPVYEGSSCSVSPQSQRGRTLQAVRFIVWDEVAMQHRYALECVDRTLRDLKQSEEPFGGAVVLFSGDFRQTLPVVPFANVNEQAAASLKSSRLWQATHRLKLRVNVRLRLDEELTSDENARFGQWLLRLGSGLLQSEDFEKIDLEFGNVKIIRQPRLFDEQMVRSMYEDAVGMVSAREWDSLADYYGSRCVITPLNKSVAKINSFLLDMLPGDSMRSTSLDTPDGDGTEAVTPEILNSYVIPNFPDHILDLKVGMPVILLRNLSIDQGLCNGTRILITFLTHHAIMGKILNGARKGDMTCLPRIKLIHKGNEVVSISFYRYQFPVAQAFCMTINKAQGQSLDHVCVLLPDPVFSHGQLYVALSRATNAQNVSICIVNNNDEEATLNIVHRAILSEDAD